MAKLVIGTDYVSADEPSMGLYEMNFLSPNGHSRRRYEIIIVMRGDKPAEYRKDMGLAKSFTAPQIRVLGGVRDEKTGTFHICHTVGELRDMANDMRLNPTVLPQNTPDVNEWLDKKKEGKLIFT